MKPAFVLAVVAAFALAGPASAATVSVLGFVQNGDSFTNVAPNAQSGTVDLNITGALGGAYADIYKGTTLANVGKYNSVRTGGSLTYNLAGLAGDAFTFIWGTVDHHNKLTINGDAGAKDVVVGNNILSLPGYTAGVSNVIVKIMSTIKFNSVTLTSSGNSFEHAFNPPELAPVPVPAAGLLLLAAVGGLGLAARRRKEA